ncbi:MAG TPA: DUF6353 family protein [Paludibacteraceae bacterium]|nr:DUF6353 family protein [Paludibacteraceae bacterium]
MSALTDVLKTAGAAINKNSPAILTAIASAGVVATAVLAAKATPKAFDAIQDEFDRRVEDTEGDLRMTRVDYVKIGWKYYIPSVVMGGVTIACIIGVNTIHTRRGAALASVYAITEKALDEYQNKVVEVIGEKKERSIRDDIAQDRLNADPLENKEIHLLNSGGEQLFYDALSGRYFMSTMQIVEKAVNDVNAELIRSSYISLNDLYDAWGLESTVLGAELGWITDNLIELQFSTKLASTGVPCVVINYRAEPTVDYYNNIQ